MKISLSWLKDYVSFQSTPESLAQKLTMAGLEVEQISKAGKDSVFEIEVTPNRADCLSVVGIAREVSAVLDKKKSVPHIKKFNLPRERCSIAIMDKEGCAQYVGTVVKTTHVAPSPQWLASRLKSLDLRLINNVVDITNFVLMEMGQPLHAFDYDKLEGGKIIVRRAKKGETIVTIDGVERTLDPSVLVIADARRPVAIAGVMGGLETEVTERTKNILLESAYFDPVLTRRTSRSLGLASDSSCRFERGVDPEGVKPAAGRALALILQETKGEIAAHADIVTGTKRHRAKPIVLSAAEINNFLGTEEPAGKYQKILKRLDFTVTLDKQKRLKIFPPSFRSDIGQGVDIIEEVARICGYDNLPSSMPVVKSSNIEPDERRIFKDKLRQYLQGQELDEIITYSTTNEEDLKKSGCEHLHSIKITNPLTQDQGIMRPTLLPSLLKVVLTNVNRGQKNFGFFELGKVYSGAGERDVLSVVITGKGSRDWQKGRSYNKQVSFFDIKGALFAPLARLHVKRLDLKKTQEPFFEAGAAASILKRAREIGIMGRIKEDVLAQWNIKEKNVLFAQIDLEFLYDHVEKEIKFEPVSEYPAITRDSSLAVKKEISFDELNGCIWSVSPKDLDRVQFAELYDGPEIPKGQRAIVLSCIYQSKQRTLRDDEVQGAHERILKALADRFEVTIR